MYGKLCAGTSDYLAAQGRWHLKFFAERNPNQEKSNERQNATNHQRRLPRRRQPECHDRRAARPGAVFDYQLMERRAHFNRERVPERVVHAKGAGAYGKFTVTRVS